MKKLLFFISVFTVLIFVGVRCEPRNESGIVFYEENWQEVLNKAKTLHKPIFLDIYASWCGPCKMLKRQTFSNKEVANYFNANFVNASFDGEVGDGVMLAGKLRISAYPSLFIISPDGNVLSTTVGFMSAKELLKFGKQVMQDR